MFDAALYYAEGAAERSGIVGRYELQEGKYVLATVHRAENTDNSERLRSIITGLDRVT